MKVGLNVPKKIGYKTFPAGCVVDLFEPDAIALINSGEGSAVPDGTMARLKAYGVPGCVPPAGFNQTLDNNPLKGDLEAKNDTLPKQNKQVNTKK